MDTDQKLQVEQRIRQEIRKAEEDIKRLEGSCGPISPDNAIGRISRMEAMSDRKINESALLEAKKRFGGLKSALANLSEPEFGTCFECGETIPIARILLMPHVKMCVSCTERYE